MNRTTHNREERARLRKMRYASLLEGTTLLLLLGVAVPLKHLAGQAGMVAVMGPLHGVAFLLYFWMTMQTLAVSDWTRGDALRMVLAALVPLGGFVNERMLARREAALAARAGE
ncbi:DUF3817 domain-containing protein [Duganella alba]|nr:DUF3817 domain-containing protein [Duganella alba]